MRVKDNWLESDMLSFCVLANKTQLNFGKTTSNQRKLYSQKVYLKKKKN